MTRSLILGVGGQDGSYLAEELLARGHEVHGMHRRSSVDNLWRIAGIRSRVKLHVGDLVDSWCVANLIQHVRPNQLWNMADQDHVGSSNMAPGYQMDVTARAVVNLLDVVQELRSTGILKAIRVFQPCSATMFGNQPGPQHEETSLAPASPYALAKAAAFLACRFYRREWGVDVRTAILFNHDSPRRKGDYLLHKIARVAARGEPLSKGLLQASTDVGHAHEYVRGMINVMDLPKPDDFCIGSGNLVAASTLAGIAYTHAGTEMSFTGEMEPPKPTHASLLADCRKAKAAFGWEAKTNAFSLVRELVDFYRG